MEYLCKNKKVREIVFGRKSRDTVPLIKAPLLGVRLTYSTSRGETFKLFMGMMNSSPAVAAEARFFNSEEWSQIKSPLPPQLPGEELIRFKSSAPWTVQKSHLRGGTAGGRLNSTQLFRVKKSRLWSPHQINTLPKWMFFQKHFFKSSLPLNG